MEGDSFKITLNIMGNILRATIKRGDEEAEALYRNAANEINKRVSQKLGDNPKMNKEQCIIATTLELAMQNMIQEKDITELTKILD